MPPTYPNPTHRAVDSLDSAYALGAVLRAGGRLAVNKMSKIPSRRAYIPAEGKDTKQVIIHVSEQYFLLR